MPKVGREATSPRARVKADHGLHEAAGLMLEITTELDRLERERAEIAEHEPLDERSLAWSRYLSSELEDKRLRLIEGVCATPAESREGLQIKAGIIIQLTTQLAMGTADTTVVEMLCAMGASLAEDLLR